MSKKAKKGRKAAAAIKAPDPVATLLDSLSALSGELLTASELLGHFSEGKEEWQKKDDEQTLFKLLDDVVRLRSLPLAMRLSMACVGWREREGRVNVVGE